METKKMRPAAFTYTSESIKKRIGNLKQLVFEVTDQCNLKCKYCGYGEFYSSYDERTNRKLNFSTAKKLIDYIVDSWKEDNLMYSPHNLSIGFYGGEPLLNVPLIKEVINYVEQECGYCITPEYNMTTNAMLLDRHIDFLVDNNFSLLISLDGDEQQHGYRVDHNNSNSFRQVYKNVKLLQQTYPDYFKNKVSFNAVLHDRNNTEGVFRFIKDEFDKIPKISQLNNSGIREDKREEFSSVFVSKQDDFYRSSDLPNMINEMFYDVADTQALYLYLENFSGNIYRYYTDLLVDKSELPQLVSGTCPPFSKKMYLTVNGKILPCERIDQKYNLGRVTENGVEMDLSEIARRYNTYSRLLENQCVFCSRRLFCNQCVFYLDIKEEGIHCPGYMNKEGFDRFVYAQHQFLSKNPQLYKRIIEELAIY